MKRRWGSASIAATATGFLLLLFFVWLFAGLRRLLGLHSRYIQGWQEGGETELDEFAVAHRTEGTVHALGCAESSDF